jgi:hypothetical protein
VAKTTTKRQLWDWVRTEYRHDHHRGKRLIGWEGLNTLALAKDVGVTPTHLRGVLTGRRAGSDALLDWASQHLGISRMAMDAMIRQAARKVKSQQRAQRRAA